MKSVLQVAGLTLSSDVATGAPPLTAPHAWEKAWGKKGYLTMPDTNLISASGADDFWTNRLLAA